MPSGDSSALAMLGASSMRSRVAERNRSPVKKSRDKKGKEGGGEAGDCVGADLQPPRRHKQSSASHSASYFCTLGAEGGEEERNPEQRLARRPVPIRVRVDGLSG